MKLLEILGIDRVEEIDKIRFETRRKREGEIVQKASYGGVIEDKYVYFIEPMCVMNLSRARISLIKTTINDSQLPLLENGVKRRRIVGSYKRERLYRFGKLKYDRVVIEPDV